MKRFAALCLVLILGVAGCTDGNDGDSSGSSTDGPNAGAATDGSDSAESTDVGVPGQLTITYSGTFDMSNEAVPQRAPHSYRYHVEWTYTWFGSRAQLLPDGQIRSDLTPFQMVDIAGTVDATYRERADGPDITCTMRIVPDPDAIPGFTVALDSSSDELTVAGVEAPTFRFGQFVDSSDPNCAGGPGVNIFEAPDDWSPLGDGGGTVSVSEGGTHDFNKRWQWQHPFDGGDARNFDASIDTTLEVIVE